MNLVKIPTIAAAVVKPVKSTYNYRNTPAVKEQLRIGGEIAAALPQMMSQSQVARALGTTQQNVSYIERQALFKIRTRLLELTEMASNKLP